MRLFTHHPLGSLIVSLALVAGTTPALARQAAGTEANSVRVPIEKYFQGHATGNAEYILQAFLPTAHIEGIRNGKLSSWTLPEYAALFKGSPAENESSRSRSIDSIDVVGTAAIAKASLVFGPTSTVVDYFLLLKVNGEWKIANKVYAQKPPGL